jgi:hypothetical protein
MGPVEANSSQWAIGDKKIIKRVTPDLLRVIEQTMN